jgi:hypothetical protein
MVKISESARIAPQLRMWRIFLKKIDGRSAWFAGFLVLEEPGGYGGQPALKGHGGGSPPL